MGEKYDAAWGVTQRLESLKRATKDLVRYIEKTEKDLVEALREADSEAEDEEQRGRGHGR